MFNFSLKVLFLILFSTSLHAETIPTVDDLNKELPQLPQQQEEQTLIEPKTDIEQVNQNQLLKILVTDILFDGNIKYSSEELKKSIENFISQELNYDDLLNVTNIISNYYRTRGFLATAYLPEQNINEGIIIIKIVEGKLGKIVIDTGSSEINLSKKRIKRFINNKLEKESVLNIGQLDKNIRQINSLYGINAVAELQEGENFGETDIKIQIFNTPMFSGSTITNNHGSRSSGTGRLSNSINIDGLFNLGERFIFSSTMTGDVLNEDQYEKSNYYALSAIFPLGYNGLQSTFRTSKMEYKLSDPFDSTKPSGYSTEYNVTLSKKLIETLTFNLNSSLSLSRNDYVNNLNTGNNSDKDTTKALLNVGFDKTDNAFGGGVNFGSISFSLGEVDLTDNQTNFETDQTTTDTNGRNLKSNLILNRLQNLNQKTNLLIKFNGQYSADNLDGSDQFSLGGVNGVRAYPSSEASGDLGFVTNLELKRNFDKFEGTLFYDYGKIKLHKHLYENWNSTNTKLKNNYILRGWGFALDATIFKDINFNATYAFTIGNNPGSDTETKDVDGLTKGNRAYFNLTKNY
ncbi:ShlB/FhaC/HecB family hemolysin secretion/activation protein [Candidatus Pelagibacter sp. Uisw_121]|uniref:ShlB/FhaC/HecB family hemolysin secretion/activation protein n=1 Tax=Candidatus Pelagibacter sp. Uisw_121 TaxID=3230987 RepID=UPI0039EAD6FC